MNASAAQASDSAEKNVKTRKELLDRLNETVSQLFAEYHNVAHPEIAVYEDWTAKDVLGHITFWHESFARNVSDIIKDIKPTPLSGRYSDLNQRCMDEMRPLTVGAIVARLESAHQAIQEDILSAKLTLIPYKKGSRDYSPAEHLDIVNEHIKEHLRAIRETVKCADCSAPVD